VVTAIATGALNTALVLGRFPTDWHSPYQALLALRIAIVATLVLVALVNRYVFVAHMTSAPGLIIRLLVVAICLDLALGASVIGLVSLFGTMDPI
jgi:copper resistance protein D